MLRLKRAAAVVAVLAVAACSADSKSPLAPDAARPTISDAAHAGVVPGFYFLPPMVSNPSTSGTLDSNLQPRVEICELVGSTCGTIIATFNFGSDVSLNGNHYQVNWHTNNYNLNVNKNYRISVFQGTFRLGYADVDVVGSNKDLKNVDTDQYIGLLDDRTLPIKFRIETGIPAQVVVTPAVDSINVGETAQFTASYKDLHGNTVSGPAPVWTSSNPAVATVDANGLATGVSAGTVTITASIGYAQGTAQLTVINPNTPPVANPDTFEAIGNVTIPVSAPGVLANDTDAEGGLTAVPGTVATANGGSATLAADGSFTYLSAAGFTGTDSFTYTATDGSLTSTATVTMKVPTRVWYVSNANASAGDGRDASPFSTLAAAEGPPTTGETIFLLYGNGTSAGYDAGFTFENGQSLTGQGVPANVTAVVNGQPLVLLAAGNAPTVTNAAPGATLRLAQNNTAQGMNVLSTAGAGVSGNGFGTFTAAAMNVAATGGPSVDLQNGTAAATFASLSSANSGGAGLRLVSVDGSLAAPGGVVSNAAGAGVDVQGGNGTVSYGGSISGSGTRAASITGRTGGALTLSGDITDTNGGILAQNNTGGSIAFTGASKSLTTGASNGVTLANNGGASISFGGGGLAITTTTGAGFSATGGGTVTVTGAGNTIASAGGTALRVDNTTIGVAGMSFRSVTAAGGVNGIALNNTGGTNGVQVTGDGSNTQNGSGGSISGTSGAAVLASGVTNLVLRSMDLHGMAGNAVDVTASSGVQVIAAHVYAPGASGVVASNLTGSNSIEKSLIDHAGPVVSGVYAVRMTSTGPSGALTLDGTTVQNKLDGTAAVSVSAQGSANIDFTVRDSNTGDGFASRFTNLFGSAIVVASGDSPGSSAHVTTRVTDSRFENAAPSGINDVELGVAQNAVHDYVIRDNLFDAVAKASAIVGVINLNATDAGRFGSTTSADSISGNTIRNIGTGSSVALLGYVGVRVAIDNTVSGINHRVVISGNSMTNLWRQGILVSSRTNADNVNVRIENNTIGTAAQPVAQSNRRAVELEAQSSSTLKVDVVNNPSIFTNATSGAASALAIRSIGSTSTVNATVLNNTIGNANGVAVAGRFRAETASGTTAQMCLDLRNNSLEDNTRLYEVQALSTGAFKVEGPGAAVVTNADITAQNTVGTGSVSGAPTFNNGANCAQPSL